MNTLGYNADLAFEERFMGGKFVRAIFPGSFDPITNGHLDVINRGMKLFDELIVAVGKSPLKNQLFTPQERIEMIAELVKGLAGVSVESFEGLTVEYARQKKADERPGYGGQAPRHPWPDRAASQLIGTCKPPAQALGLWDYYGTIKGLLWYYLGTILVLSWYSQGTIKGLSRY